MYYTELMFGPTYWQRQGTAFATWEEADKNGRDWVRLYAERIDPNVRAKNPQFQDYPKEEFEVKYRVVEAP
jgi:hypothetical protein